VDLLLNFSVFNSFLLHNVFHFQVVGVRNRHTAGNYPWNVLVMNLEVVRILQFWLLLIQRTCG
jgi:hypothetical protein